MWCGCVWIFGLESKYLIRGLDDEQDSGWKLVHGGRLFSSLLLSSSSLLFFSPLLLSLLFFLLLLLPLLSLFSLSLSLSLSLSTYVCGMCVRVFLVLMAHR